MVGERSQGQRGAVSAAPEVTPFAVNRCPSNARTRLQRDCVLVEAQNTALFWVLTTELTEHLAAGRGVKPACPSAGTSALASAPLFSVAVSVLLDCDVRLKSGHCGEGGMSPACLTNEVQHLSCPPRGGARFLFPGCALMSLLLSI